MLELFYHSLPEWVPKLPRSRLVLRPFTVPEKAWKETLQMDVQLEARLPLSLQTTQVSGQNRQGVLHLSQFHIKVRERDNLTPFLRKQNTHSGSLWTLQRWTYRERERCIICLLGKKKTSKKTLVRYPGPSRAKGKVKSKEMEEESTAWLKSGQKVLKLAYKYEKELWLLLG